MLNFIFAAILMASSIQPSSADTVDVIGRSRQFSSSSLGKYIRNESIFVRWAKDDPDLFWYSSTSSSGIREYYEVSLKSPRNKSSDPQKSSSAQNLSVAVKVDSIPEARLWRSGDGLLLSRSGKRDWKKSWSADSLYYVSALSHDLYLYKVAKDTRTVIDSVRLTHDGVPYGSWAVSGNTQASSDGNGSPVGEWIGRSHSFLAVREDKSKVGTLSLVDNLADPRPAVKTFRYAMPGDENVPQYEAVLADADRMQAIPLPEVSGTKDSRIVLPRFSAYPHDDRFAYLVRMSRTCDTLDLVRIDSRTRSSKLIIRNFSKPHFNDQLFNYRLLEGGKEILWWEEKGDKGQYWLYDNEGRLKNAVTTPDMVAGPVLRVDEKTREIIFIGYGHDSSMNPSYAQVFKASLDGKLAPLCLTPENAEHEVSFSPDGKYLFDTYSRMDMPPHFCIRDMNGSLRFEFEPCDISELEAHGWKAPEVIALDNADGTGKLYGIVYKPFDLDPSKKYPIISNVYPGPQMDMIPESFTFDDNGNQTLAQMGFIVINFSHRGSSPLLGKTFYTYGYGNLRDYPIADDMAIIRQIAKRYPYADLSRVGIYGHSGGGFQTVTSMLERPDFYKVGVAASGNYDNNIYMQYWGETFHGPGLIPTDISLAANLQGKLLLMTGDSDSNVHPSSTFRLAEALIKAGKRFDLMVFPGGDHSIGGPYYDNLIWTYFVENLLGAKTLNPQMNLTE